MFFSKTFGYALRGILYIAIRQDENRLIQIDEIAKELAVPRHFLGKILKDLVKAGLLKSTKGPYGGFSLSRNTLKTSLIRLLDITDGHHLFNRCVLQLGRCNGNNPCPLHSDFELIKNNFKAVFAQTTIEDMLGRNKKEFLKSLVTYEY